MEKFVFDVFQFSEKFTVLEVARNEEFSPLKNPPGATKCSPETCLDDLSNQHQRWIIRSGGTFKNEGLCEISPLVSCNGENLEDLVKDKFFSLPLHLEVTRNGYHNGHIGTNGLHSKL